MYHIDKIEEQLKLAKKHRYCMKKGMMIYEKICQDYEHLIESYRYNAAQGAKILAGLRDARIRRRFYKDNIHVMDSVIDNLQRAISNVNASQRRANTHSGWNVNYGEDIKAIIRMREKK